MQKLSLETNKVSVMITALKKIWVKMKLKHLLLVLLSSLCISAFADDGMNSEGSQNMQHPFYVGVMSGYGNTDWGQLVAKDGVSSYATPLSASGSGAIIGALAGYQVTPYISVEAQYIHYPNTTIAIDNTAGPNKGKASPFSSATNYYAIMPKVLAPFDNDHYEAFGILGMAFVTRSDELANINNFRPTFGLGITDKQSAHWEYSLAFNYTPGTGVASLHAESQYIPYLYAGEIIITYRI